MDNADKYSWIDLECAIQAIKIDKESFRNLVHAVAGLPVDEDTMADLLDHVINLRGADPVDINRMLKSELEDHGIDFPV